MTQLAIVTDLNRCVGCMSCMVACKAENNVTVGNFWNKLLRVGPTRKADYVRTNDVEMYYIVMQCQHCTNPPCVDVCPTGASTKREDGLVQIDAAACIGCQTCVPACPYGVRYLDEDENIVKKCTMCAQLVDEGGLPQCVSQCGGRARFFGDIEQGIENLEAPDIAYSAERDPAVTSYEAQFTGNRIKLGDLVAPFEESDVYRLDDQGNGPNMAYILRNRTWHEGKTMNDPVLA